MPSTTAEYVDTELQRAELQAVLQSPLFVRSPTLTHLLSYLCEKVFAGETDQIKEYTIALEVFGRGESFDQDSDSIVRVEVNRLRKRLAEYYSGEGAGHRLRITIPVGQYVPVFEPGPLRPRYPRLRWRGTRGQPGCERLQQTSSLVPVDCDRGTRYWERNWRLSCANGPPTSRGCRARRLASEPEADPALASQQARRSAFWPVPAETTWITPANSGVPIPIFPEALLSKARCSACGARRILRSTAPAGRATSATTFP